MSKTAVSRVMEVAVMALAEAGFPGSYVCPYDDNKIVHPVDLEPPCDVMYRAFQLGLLAYGQMMFPFDVWHAGQDERWTCTCAHPSNT